MKKHLLHASVCALAWGAILPSIAQSPRNYSVTKHVAIGGEGSWDYLRFDAASHRLYIAHQTKIEVVNTDTNEPVGAIEGLTRCHGVVIMPDGKTGFASDGGTANQVVVFDPLTLKIVKTIPGGKNPDGLLYEKTSGMLWVFNNTGKDVTVIDPKAMQVVSTLALPGKPEFPATDDKGAIFVNIEDTNSLAQIDAQDRSVKAVWPLAGCDSPSGLAFDSSRHQLYSVCANKTMVVTDSRNGKSLGTAAIGPSPDAVVFDPKHKLAFASSMEGTITVVDTTTPQFAPVETIQTMKGARTMAANPDASTLYTVSAQLGDTPAPTPTTPHPRAAAIPGTFELLVLGRKPAR